MEIKDLQRETIYTERIAELGRVVLNLNEQLSVKTSELDAAKRDIAERDATIAAIGETANGD